MILGLFLILQHPQFATAASELVSFQNKNSTLHGVLYKPEGSGPFPALLYNHGSAPGMLNQQAFDELGPLFARHGWVFFAPYRRGQGLSATAGRFIGDEIAAARNRGFMVALVVALPALVLLFVATTRKRGGWIRVMWSVALLLVGFLVIDWNGTRAGAAAMVRSLETDQLSDQLAALEWLRAQGFVQKDRIAAAGNSFGGVETVLGAERADSCAAIDASGGAESWASAPQLRERMVQAVRNSQAPIFFFQAENDYDLRPSRTLSAAMQDVGKYSEVKIYPAFGGSPSDGHRFAWSGSAVWADDVFRFLDTYCVK